MPAVALSRVGACVVESWPGGEDLAVDAWQRLEALPDPRSPRGRFCSARCRAAWNRRHASDTPADTSALDWSIIAMRETIGRLCRADGFAVISEAVWRVTIVDAALMKYYPEIYTRVLARQDPGQRRITEETFAGLRFVRNRMGYDTHPAELIQSLDFSGVAAWTWKPVREPVLGTLTPRSRTWEMSRYQAYQAQLVNRPVGGTFTQAATFLGSATDGILSHALKHPDHGGVKVGKVQWEREL